MDAPAAALGRKLLELSRLLARSGRVAEAEAALLKAAAALPEERTVYANLCELRMDAGRFDEAAQALQLGLERVPGWDDGRLELIRMHIRQARFPEAEKELARLSDAAGRAPRAAVLRARLAAHRGALPEAAEYFAAALAGLRDAETALGLAEVLFRLDRGEEAVAALRATPPGAGARPYELSWEFRRAFFARDFDAAFAVGERMLDATRDPDLLATLRWPSFVDEYDFSYPPEKDRREVLAALERRPPDDAWAAYYAFLYREEFKDAGSGKRAAQDARSLARFDAARYGWMRLECAKARLYEGDFEGALGDFAIAAKTTVPEHWMAHCHAGETAICLGRVDEGLASMDRAVAVAAPIVYGNALGWKGEMLLWSGRYAEALPILDEARARGAQYAHTWIGGCLLKLGRPAEALAALDRAVELSFGDHEAKLWRAETLLALGRAEECLRQLDAMPDVGASALFVYMRALRGLAEAERDDTAAERAAAALPARVREALGGGGGRRLLEEVLARSRGVRRGGYAMRAWLGS